MRVRGWPREQGYPGPAMADRSRPNGGARLEIPPIATELGERFRLAGHELYLVGGVVRDLLLGRELGGDLDFATDAVPRETTMVLRGWAERLYLVGVRFGTVGARSADQVLEITTFREEVYAEEHRKPVRHVRQGPADRPVSTRLHRERDGDPSTRG